MEQQGASWSVPYPLEMSFRGQAQLYDRMHIQEGADLLHVNGRADEAVEVHVLFSTTPAYQAVAAPRSHDLKQGWCRGVSLLC